jgi:serine/threonine protein kinase
MIDHYKVLQVDSQAEEQVIVAAYHALVKMYSKETDKLTLLNNAKNTLTKGRKDYDNDRRKKHGKIIGDYEIISQIAEGGFGTTYKAKHRTLESLVCIKHALNISSTAEKVLLDESRLMWDLRHWGIPAIRDILRMPDGSLALVMSYVPGPTLAQILEKHPNGIDPEHVAWITERLLNILQYLHFHGIVHSDIKPQNVIIQPESHTVVLVDYGLSAFRPKHKTDAKGYTPYFAAPEQIAGGTPIPETDFYSLGMTLIFALGGDVEFVKVPNSTPTNLCTFIKQLIRREPLSRPNWGSQNLCESIKKVRQEDFGRTASMMKPLMF